MDVLCALIGRLGKPKDEQELYQWLLFRLLLFEQQVEDLESLLSLEYVLDAFDPHEREAIEKDIGSASNEKEVHEEFQMQMDEFKVTRVVSAGVVSLSLCIRRLVIV